MWNRVEVLTTSIPAATDAASPKQLSTAPRQFWIANGQFHLIPLSYVSAEGGSRPASELDNKHYLSADDAIRALSPQSLAPQAVKGAILARVEGFMQTLRNKTHYHRAIMQLPVEIVEILEAQPGLVAKAVTAFYERDAIQLKVRLAGRCCRADAIGRVSLKRIILTTTGLPIHETLSTFPPQHCLCPAHSLSLRSIDVTEVLPAQDLRKGRLADFS